MKIFVKKELLPAGWWLVSQIGKVIWLRTNGLFGGSIKMADEFLGLTCCGAPRVASVLVPGKGLNRTGPCCSKVGLA